MDEDSRSSEGSGPYSPQLIEQQVLIRTDGEIIANLKQENRKIKGDYANLMEDFNHKWDNLKAEMAALRQVCDNLKQEIYNKNSTIASQNDEIRVLKGRLNSNNNSGNNNKNNNINSRSRSRSRSLEIRTESESDSQTEDSLNLGSRKGRNKKRKGKHAHSEVLVKKSACNDTGVLEVMEISPQSELDSNFPPLEIRRNTTPTRQGSEGRQNVSGGSSNLQKGNDRNHKLNRNNSEPSRVKIPPVVLRDKSRYNAITAEFNRLKINFEHAKTLPEGIRLQPCSIQDFRAMTKFLDEKKEKYHSYQLSEDKLLHVVFRGVLETFTEEEIAEDLEKKGYSPKKVIRWYHKNKRPMPIVLVLLPKTDSKIFQEREIKLNSVKVEAQKTKARSTQCFNCQLFGHSAFGCKADPRCSKCGEGHASRDCNNKEAKRKCANCSGEHPASYGGCPKHPKHQALQQQKQQAPQRSFKWGSQDNTKLAANPENMGTAINAIKEMNAAMQQFFRNMQMMQQQFASTFMATPST